VRSEKEWLDEFKAFLQAEGAPVPREVSENILNHVRRDLNPSAWVVFAKLLGVHLVVGTLSLAICSQFGLNPFGTSFSLSEYFMTFGHSTCMFLCGVLFIGLTIVLGQLVLRREELLVLSKKAPLQVFGLSIFSLAALIGFGAEVVLGIGVLWFVGAMLGGLVTTKMLVRKPSLA